MTFEKELEKATIELFEVRRQIEAIKDKMAGNTDAPENASTFWAVKYALDHLEKATEKMEFASVHGFDTERKPAEEKPDCATCFYYFRCSKKGACDKWTPA